MSIGVMVQTSLTFCRQYMKTEELPWLRLLLAYCCCCSRLFRGSSAIAAGATEPISDPELRSQPFKSAHPPIVRRPFASSGLSVVVVPTLVSCRRRLRRRRDTSGLGRHWHRQTIGARRTTISRGGGILRALSVATAAAGEVTGVPLGSS